MKFAPGTPKGVMKRVTRMIEKRNIDKFSMPEEPTTKGPKVKFATGGLSKKLEPTKDSPRGPRNKPPVDRPKGGPKGGPRGAALVPQVLPSRLPSSRPTVDGRPAPDYGTMNQKTAMKKGGSVQQPKAKIKKVKKFDGGGMAYATQYLRPGTTAEDVKKRIQASRKK